VETGEQVAYLRRHRCDFIQGYFFSRPLPVLDLETLLREKKCLPAVGVKGGRKAARTRTDAPARIVPESQCAERLVNTAS